jgi:hypothetical protein
MRRGYHNAMQLDNRTLDPGRVQENKLDSTYSLLRTAVVSTIDVSEENDMEESSRTELDSHANMPVVGRNAYIISDTGRVADVIRLRLTTIQCIDDTDCRRSRVVFEQRCKALYDVPEMKNNLLPPFVMREAGIKPEFRIQVE